MSRFAIIADDLTGASDTGIKLKVRGYKVDVVFRPDKIEPMLENSKIISINTISREDDAAVAHQKLTNLIQVLKNNGFNKIYKKVDSVFRGNAGVEIEALLNELDLNMVFLAPAIPSNGRIIKNGYLYIDEDKENIINVNKLLEDTSKLNVKNVTLDDMKKGKEWVLEKISTYAQEKSVVILFDTEKHEDFELITQVFSEYPEEYLPAGASGLANSLPEIWDIKEQGGKTHLIISGSYHKVTSDQLECLMDNLDCEVIRINTRKVIEGEVEFQFQRVLNQMKTITAKGNKPEIIVVTVDTYLEENIQANWENSSTILDFIAKVVRSIIETGCCKTITVTGGESAYYVMESIDAIGMHLIDEIVSGIPCGIIIGGIADGLQLATKSGGFGDKDAFIKIIKYFINNGKDVFLSDAI